MKSVKNKMIVLFIFLGLLCVNYNRTNYTNPLKFSKVSRNTLLVICINTMGPVNVCPKGTH